jgi:N-acetylmuramoyl-L-alanine amidase
MKITQVECISYDERKEGSQIDSLIMHYTGMETEQAAIDRLCSPEWEVSSHYIVLENGAILQLVPEEKRAWHAGRSDWRDKTELNHSSIGIEITNKGHEFGYTCFLDAQMIAIIELSKAIIKQHNIPARNVIGHSDITPARKEDPGELFNWQLLAENGIGLFPKVSVAIPEILISSNNIGEKVVNLQHRLAAYGYKIEITGVYDKQTEIVVMAFKRHFSPSMLSESWDSLSEAMLEGVLTGI